MPQTKLYRYRKQIFTHCGTAIQQAGTILHYACQNIFHEATQKFDFWNLHIYAPQYVGLPKLCYATDIHYQYIQQKQTGIFNYATKI